MLRVPNNANIINSIRAPHWIASKLHPKPPIIISTESSRPCLRHRRRVITIRRPNMYHFLLAKEHAHLAGSARWAICDRESRSVGELVGQAWTEGTYVLLDVGSGAHEILVYIIFQDVKITILNQYGRCLKRWLQQGKSMGTYATTLFPEMEVFVTVELPGVCTLGAKIHGSGLLSIRVWKPPLAIRSLWHASVVGVGEAVDDNDDERVLEAVVTKHEQADTTREVGYCET